MDGHVVKLSSHIVCYENMKTNRKNKVSEKGNIVESDGGVVISNAGLGHDRSYITGFDKIAVAVLLLVGLFYLISSIIQITYVFTDEFDSLIFTREVIQIFAGAILIFGAIRFIRKNTYLEQMVDQMFDEIIYDRFEPVLRDIAEVQVGYDSVSNQIRTLNYSINDLKKSIEFAPSQGAYQSNGASTSASLRRVYNLFMYIVFLNITLAVYMFMIYYPQWYIPYLSPLLFVMWWVAITYEHDQWGNSSAWMWVFAPILILPIYTMVFGLLTSTNQMFAIMYVMLGLYAVTYYTWSMYNASGTLPFGLHEKLEDIANYDEIDDDDDGEDFDRPRNGGLYRNSGEDFDTPRNGGLYRNSGEDFDMPRNGGLYRNSGEDFDMPRNGGLYRNSGEDLDMSCNGGLYRNRGSVEHDPQNGAVFSDRMLLIREEIRLLHEEMEMYSKNQQPNISQYSPQRPNKITVKNPIFAEKLVKGIYKKLIRGSIPKPKKK